jgi:hypothetical protein
VGLLRGATQFRRGRAETATPKIGPVLALIALIFVGVAVIVVSAVLLLRPARVTESRGPRHPQRSRDLEQGEREVYEKLYGKRSATVSAPWPVEPVPKADAGSPRTHTPSAQPRTRSRDSHR